MIRQPEPAEYDALLGLWLRSVRATHTFLTEADIQALLPLVRESVLPVLELWALYSRAGGLMGFMGLQQRSIEALFIAPEYLRQGGGRALLGHAIELKGLPVTVDVNEQNAAATQFYLANGFIVTGRSPLDSAGRPFPLLHLQRAQ